jgi:hypothetical protein
MEQICLIGGLVTIGSVALALSTFNTTHNTSLINSHRLFKQILFREATSNSKNMRRRSLSSSLNDSNNNRLAATTTSSPILRKDDDDDAIESTPSTAKPSILTYERTFYLLALSLLIGLSIFTYNKVILNTKSNDNLHAIVYHAFSLVLFVNFFCMLKSYAEYSSAFREKFFRQRIASTAQMLNTAVLCVTLKVWPFFFVLLYFF